MTTMDKVYNPAQVEALSPRLGGEGILHPQVDPDKKPFCIVIPPPNITGQLHGPRPGQHDAGRHNPLQAHAGLFHPVAAGTDHASIATEVKVVDAMAEEGLTKRPWAGRSPWSAPGTGSAVRRAHRAPAAQAGFLLRLEPGTFHHGRGLLQGRGGGSLCACTRRA